MHTVLRQVMDRHKKKTGLSFTSMPIRDLLRLYGIGSIYVRSRFNELFRLPIVRCPMCFNTDAAFTAKGSL